MKTLRAGFLLGILCFSAAGCASTKIRPGVWELTFDVKYSHTEEKEDIEPRLVRVLVERASSGSEAIEEIEITALNDSLDLAPMYGDIRPDRMTGGYKVTITHERDRDWVWNMFGFVRNEEHIAGTNCFARGRYANLGLQGQWSMRWKRDT